MSMQTNKGRVAVIILDSGFSPEVLARVRNLLAYQDLNTGLSLVGKPFIQGEARGFLHSIARDPLNHGSIILERLLDMDPDLPLVLVRAFAPQGGLIRTGFEQGAVVADGWTEAYLWAQNICAQKGYMSVANFSFGGFHHTLDGQGWENFQLSRVVGPGKPGHLLAGAAGPGDGRAVHASLTVEPGKDKTGYLHAIQSGDATYNLLVDRLVDGAEVCDFEIEATFNGQHLFHYRGLDLRPNIWNGKQQFTFDVYPQGFGVAGGELTLAITVAGERAARFDVFISREDGSYFRDCVDSELVCEPALYDSVIAVGLGDAAYGVCRVGGIKKPEVLVSGHGPISFRTPEVTFALVKMLAENPNLDVPAARAQLLAQS
ncbi:MAG: hypothetical protein JSS86_08180 [Cyanobacteria bacterium SZAS LIN-2]|nr:hypothetical protein [Cyanobacteria bacterium SZAS LIN-2]